MNFNEISGENVTFDIKNVKKQSSGLSSDSIFFETFLGFLKFQYKFLPN